MNEEVVEGKRFIEEAIACGDFIATYIRGVMLLCESNPKGIGNLLEVLNDEHGKHRLLKCQKYFYCLLRELPCFKLQTFKHAKKLEWDIGIGINLILMVMKNLWLCAKDARSTLKCLSW